MNVGDNFAPQFHDFVEPESPLTRISELALRLSAVAAEPDAWKEFQLTAEGREVVIDRIENQIQTYVTVLRKQGHDEYFKRQELYAQNHDLALELERAKDAIRSLRETLNDIFYSADASADGHDEINEDTPEAYIKLLEGRLDGIHEMCKEMLK